MRNKDEFKLIRSLRKNIIFPNFYIFDFYLNPIKLLRGILFSFYDPFLSTFNLLSVL